MVCILNYDGGLVMNKNIKKVISVILIVSLATLSCSTLTVSEPVTATSTSTSQMESFTETPMPTETPTATNEPPPEFYAGFTQNEEIPFIVMHRSGESLGAIGGIDVSNIKGVVWASSDGKSSMVIYADSNGLPKSAVVGEDVIQYSNYTNDTVDITVVHPDGKSETFQAKRDIDLLNKIKTLVTPSFSTISYSTTLTQPLEVDELLLINQLAYIAGAASCLLAVTGGPLALAALALPCTGTLIGGIVMYGNMLGLHVAFLEELGASWTAFKCPLDLAQGNPIACFSTYATLSQKLKELADQKIEIAEHQPGTQQLGMIQDWSVSSLPGTVTQLSNCRYGPDWPYLYKYGVRAGTRMEVIGRDADGNWLLVQGVGGHNSCWIKAVQIEVDGDVMSLPDAYPFTQNLPISPFFPQITITGVSSNGGFVNVSWLDHIIRADLDTEQGIKFIVEVWTCVDGKPNFTAIGTNETSASFQIDNSCGMVSHADVIGEDKEGFSPPAQIALP